jgi:hypothetical protein
VSSPLSCAAGINESTSYGCCILGHVSWCHPPQARSLHPKQCSHAQLEALIPLFARCRLPTSIQAPHERSSLSPAQYSRWLDQHSAADVARGVLAALDAAKAAAAQVADPGQRAVLQVMSQLCASASAAPQGGDAAAV